MAGEDEKEEEEGAQDEKEKKSTQLKVHGHHASAAREG